MASNLKSFLKYAAYKTVLRPPYIRYCSQTIYETLLGCLRMFEQTAKNCWRLRADRLLRILHQIQQPDGGFDIGYDFNFGMLHQKGQPTSPELVGLVALAEYARLLGKDGVVESATRAANWIRENVVDMTAGKYAIPYSPYSTHKVMVYNGVSFAAGALGCYLGYVSYDEQLHRIYRGMIAYLRDIMSRDIKLPGRFWYYNEQSRSDLSERTRIKIDYYHQMQQVEMHALAEQACHVDGQCDIIMRAADFIAALQTGHKVIPYYNEQYSSKQEIHSWGLASVIPGMLEAAVVVPQRKEVYYAVAHRVLEWLLNHAWNGKYFIPILSPDGRVISQDYMVRSDAWVFNALAAAQKHLASGPWTDIVELCFSRMESAAFSGLESHASRRSGRFLLSIYNKYRQINQSHSCQ